MIVVVAAVIRDGDRYLVCRRPAHKRHGGLWEFPGGKVEEGETPADAVRRELKEELALEVVSVGATRFVATDPGTDFRVEFIEVTVAGAPVPLEHSAVAWHGPRSLASLSLAPSDAAFVAAHLRGARWRLPHPPSTLLLAAFTAFLLSFRFVFGSFGGIDWFPL